MKRLLLFLLLLSTPLHADVLRKVGVIDKATGAATASQPVTGVGFTPKVLILYTVGATAVATTEKQFGISWASGAGEEWASSWYWEDNVSTTDNNKNYQNAKLIGDFSGNGTASALADITSMDADGFTLSWTTNTANAIKLAYIAIGGSDIEAQVTNHAIPTASDSAKTYAHGLSGGAPDIVFFMSSNGTSTGLDPNSSFSFGAAMSSSSRWSLAVSAADAATLTANQDAVKRQTTAKCLQGIQVGSVGTDGTLIYEIDYVSDDATNVTVNFTTPGTVAYAFSMLSIRGGSWALGATDKELDAEPSDQTIASGLSGTTKLLMMASFGAAATANSVNDAEFSFGATDGTTEGSVLGVQEGTTLPTQVGIQLSDSKVIRLGRADAGGLAVENEADFKEFSSGNAIVTWTTNDNSIADQILWATLGSSQSVVPVLSNQWRRRRQ